MIRTVTPCRILVYTLSQEDAEAINRRRTNGPSIAQRIAEKIWPLGAQAHIGSEVLAGMEFPAMTVRVVEADYAAPESTRKHLVNMQVFLDGNDTFWAQQILEGTGPGTWRWPV